MILKIAKNNNHNYADVKLNYELSVKMFKKNSEYLTEKFLKIV